MNTPVLYEGISPEKIELIKSMYCKGCSDEELQLFLHVCQKTGLDPMMKQIYAIKRGSAMTIQTSIDGYRLIAERTGKYSPGREPTFSYKDGKILCATAYIKKMTPDGTWHEVGATAFFDEYCQKYDGKPSKFWDKMGHVMISKCAEALALRKAFPDYLSAIYTEEEMMQAENSKESIEVKAANEILKLEDKKTEANNEKINDDQIKEISKELGEFDEGYQEKIWLWLGSKGIAEWKDVSLKIYESLKTSFKNQRDKSSVM